MKEVTDEYKEFLQDRSDAEFESSNLIQQQLLFAAYSLLISGVALSTTSLLALNFSNQLVATALGIASAPILVAGGFFGGAAAFFKSRDKYKDLFTPVEIVDSEFDALIDSNLSDPSIMVSHNPDESGCVHTI